MNDYYPIVHRWFITEYTQRGRSAREMRSSMNLLLSLGLLEREEYLFNLAVI